MISIVRSDGHVVQAKHVDDATLVAGVNDRVQLAELGAELNRRIVAAHQRAGVTIVDPATTWIDVDVTIGRDTVIHPGTQLLGSTRIGGRCRIGPDTTLTDVTVGDEAAVVAHPRRIRGDRRRRRRGAVHLPTAGHRARRATASSARSSKPRTRRSAKAPRCRT